MAKRGRPPKLDAKKQNINFRLADDEASMLSELSKITGRTRTDIFVDLMKKEYSRVTEEDA
jgi:uncharacterized protein (DUF1778 family)